MKTRFRRGHSGNRTDVAQEQAHHQQALRHHKKSKKLSLLLVFLVLSTVIVGGTAFYLYRQTKKQTNNATQSLQDIITTKRVEDSQQTLESTYGMKVKYNADLLEAEGHTRYDDGSFNVVYGDGLKNKAKDGYLIFTFVLKNEGNTEESMARFGSLSGPKLWVTTTTNKDFFEKGRQKYGKDKSDEDVAATYYAPQKTDTSTPTLIKQEDVTINNVKYKKSTYEITDTEFITTKNELTVVYTTVQNGRPYQVKLDSTKQTSHGDLVPLEQTIRSISYTAPDSSAKFTFATLKVLASHVLGTSTSENSGQNKNENGELPDNSVNAPSKLADGTALKIVAKNQPAVVRVGTQTCFDYNLLLPNNKVAIAAKEACMASSGSGSIVSKDGYVSTNGHVTTFKPSDTLVNYLFVKLQAGDKGPLQAYFNYLIDSGVMSAKEIDALLQAVQNKDETAIMKLIYTAELIPADRYQVTATNPEYAIQLGNEPIKVERVSNSSKVNFKYDDKVVKAKFIAADFDPFSGKEGTSNLIDSKTSDVAILKMEGNKQFPVVNLGSIDNLKSGSLITAIGFPAFVDGGIETKKEKTVPSATQGEVEEIVDDSKDEGARKLVATSVPIAGGNSGGPAFDENGHVIGLTTYAMRGKDEADDKFSDNGIIRDIADYKKLLANNKVTLDTKSEISDNWDKAIDEFAQAHYKASLGLFKKVQAAYPAHYLAAQFADVAQQKIGKGEDASAKSSSFIVLAVVFGILAATIVVVVVLLIRHRKHGKQMGYTVPYPTPAPLAGYPNAYPQQNVMPQQANPYLQPQPPVPPAPNVVAPGTAYPSPPNTQVPSQAPPTVGSPPPPPNNNQFPPAPPA